MIQRPPELFVSERPVRSDYARERSYARRRVVTVIVLALALGGTAYAIWGRGAPNPADIPTIRAEASYKQKPADPGGIDIPHQDVRVYDQLESRNASAPPVEHLLPPPEAPETPPAAPVEASSPPAAPVVATAPLPAPPAAVPAAPVSAPKPDILPAVSAKPVATTAAPAPVAKTPPASPTQSLTIEQIIERTKASPPSVPVSISSRPAAGDTAIQLASVPDQAQAQATMENLRQKYAAQLGSVTLQLVRADLGSRGVYYRIQSQGLAEAEASRLCSQLKQMNAGCILVRK